MSVTTCMYHAEKILTLAVFSIQQLEPEQYVSAFSGI